MSRLIDFCRPLRGRHNNARIAIWVKFYQKYMVKSNESWRHARFETLENWYDTWVLVYGFWPKSMILTKIHVPRLTYRCYFDDIEKVSNQRIWYHFTNKTLSKCDENVEIDRFWEATRGRQNSARIVIWVEFCQKYMVKSNESWRHARFETLENWYDTWVLV